MTSKSRIFLGLAAAALSAALASRIVPGLVPPDAGDFAVGLGAAFMFGVLVT